jgi:hypothetical protein
MQGRGPEACGNEEKISQGPEHLDSYFTKLQALCLEASAQDENRAIYETVRMALPDFTIPPTPI